jgi:hypothetical protein
MTSPVFRIRICMFLGLPDPHPDPLDRGTDPRIRIRAKMSRIQYTASTYGTSRYLLKAPQIHRSPQQYENAPYFWNI